MFGRKSAAEKEKTPENLFSRILLVVDGSEPSIAAAHYAVHLAKQTDGELTAVYVVDSAAVDYLLQMRIFVREERQEFERDLEQSGKRYLDYVKTMAGKESVALDTVLRHGSFHQTILKVARELDSKVIVLGGWKQTVTRKDATSVERQLILSEAECPVITVKAQK